MCCDQFIKINCLLNNGSFVTASQLRKCYMGARVKKTVREQLEEMRMNDVFDGVNEADSTKINRARKRKSNSDSHGK